MHSAKPKPCRDCRGKAEVSTYGLGSLWSVWCTRCLVTCGLWRTEADAIAAWSKRAESGKK